MSSRAQDPAAAAWTAFLGEPAARIGLAGFGFLLVLAVAAPFLANGKPLLMLADGHWSAPFLRSFFAPESSEVMVEKIFNYILLAALWMPLTWLLPRKWRTAARVALAVAALLPFLLTSPKMDKRDYRIGTAGAERVVFAPIPYGPDEIAGEPCAAPSREHWLGCDDIGRDLAARIIYGGRVSLAVGILSTIIAMSIGVTVGMAAGFFRGRFDLVVMRLVEILICFPTFLLLLILMSMLGDADVAQSIPLVVAVLGLSGWLHPAMLVRGETLKQSAMPYVQSCIVSGLSARKIMFRHLLPNIMPPVLISFTFAVAGAIMGESGLSFLGFGVQQPTASWGNLLRQAFDNPMSYWHLTLFPGLALFLAVLSINFMGEGLRRAFDAGGTR